MFKNKLMTQSNEHIHTARYITAMVWDKECNLIKYALDMVILNEVML